MRSTLTILKLTILLLVACHSGFALAAGTYLYCVGENGENKGYAHLSTTKDGKKIENKALESLIDNYEYRNSGDQARVSSTLIKSGNFIWIYGSELLESHTQLYNYNRLNKRYYQLLYFGNLNQAKEFCSTVEAFCKNEYQENDEKIYPVGAKNGIGGYWSLRFIFNDYQGLPVGGECINPKNKTADNQDNKVYFAYELLPPEDKMMN